MKLTEKTVTRQSLEALTVDGIIYLVPINTDKEGYHYIAGFESKEQCRMYRSLLNGLSFDAPFLAQNMTVDQTLDAVNYQQVTLTPVNEYRITKADPIKSTHPELTTKDLLSIAAELLEDMKPKQVEQEIKAPKVKEVVKGKLPEYLKPLYILSSATYQTEKGISYRIAVVNKDSSTATATDSTFLILNTRNRYKGFADSELKAIELADFIIY